MAGSEDIREQYNRFPYPPISFLALPLREEGKSLRFDAVSGRPHQGIRILVAGAGTFEALVVAQAHPDAAEVVAIDLSAASLGKLKKRIRLHRLARFHRRLPRIRLHCSDLVTDEIPGRFDYILASNCLHHVENPASLLAKLSANLLPGGLLRLVTYPKMSRVWMRATSQYLKDSGLGPLTPGLVRAAREKIRLLPQADPRRSCFESHTETGTLAGLVDAFFNALENPLSPLEWRDAASAAGVKLVCESQTETSRSDFLTELLPATQTLDAWTKLQVLDDLLELCANPVLWLEKTAPARPHETPRSNCSRMQLTPEKEIHQALKRVESTLGPLGVTLPMVRAALETQVGPRISPDSPDKVLPGLSILDANW